MVGIEGFEPPTLCSQSTRATGLRYIPKLTKGFVSFSGAELVLPEGFEPSKPVAEVLQTPVALQLYRVSKKEK